MHLAAVDRAGGRFHRAWAGLMADVLVAEADGLPPRAQLPTALVAAPAPLTLSSRRELVEAVLAPARSGMVVTRADLVRAGSDLGLGVRRGERRLALDGLLDQDPAGILAWLGRAAEEWACMLPRWHPGALDPVGRWWEGRARAAADVLAGAAARVAA